MLDEDDNDDNDDNAYGSDSGEGDAESDPNDDEHEEEEDLGWGSDDDEISVEEENDSGNDEVTVGTEEVVFSSNKNSGSDEILSNKCDVLQKDLHDALEKIKELEGIVKGQQEQLNDASRNKTDLNNGNELEKLKLQLFEKDSELAAIKATLEEIVEDKVNDQEVELKRLRSELKSKEKELEQCHKTIREADAIQDEEDAKDSEMLSEALETITALQSELDSSKLEAAEEIAAIRNHWEDQVTEFTEEVQKLQDALTKEKIAKENVSRELLQAKSTVEHLLSEIEALREASLSKDNHNANERAALLEAKEKISVLQSEVKSTRSELASITTSTSEEIQKLKETLYHTESSNASLQSELACIKDKFSDLQNTSNEVNNNNDASALGDALTLVSDLQSELKRTKDQLSTLQNELSSLHDAKCKHQADASGALEEAHETIKVLEKRLEETKHVSSERIDQLTSELETSKLMFQESKEEFEEKVAQLKSKLQLLDIENKMFENRATSLKTERNVLHDTNQSEVITSLPSSPNEGSSFSSGVEVQQPSSSTKGNKDCDGAAEDDGWGDDWSDDE
jgi:chromosome segregation ATPase